MARYEDISSFDLINDVDTSKVNALVESMLKKGWQGAPILFVQDYGLVTGSHRLAALHKINQMYCNGEIEEADVLFEDIALDVTDIVIEFCEKNEVTFDELPFDSLSDIFAGTEIEKFASMLEEW